MLKNISYKLADGTTKTVQISEEPDFCPLCHRNISPVFIRAHRRRYLEELEIVYKCTNEECDRFFIAYYSEHNHYFIHKGSAPWFRKKIQFPEIIKELSENFCNIYNQAHEAEKRNLLEICGAGYRKALEFLVKDYTIKKNKKYKKKITRMRLSNCINTYIDEERIKSCAERAVWLGNDETHYYRRWESKELEDLKILIKLTINWIENILLSDKYKNEMKERNKKTKIKPPRR